MTSTPRDLSKKAAFRFVILLSLVSLFADVTYEGARSITGPFLATLGASATVVGFVAGFGELVGYTLRMASGYLADYTRKYWAITIVGYLCNLLAVPLLALAGNWWLAATLMVIERMGRAIRIPPRDAMLSHAGQSLGMGWIFGLHEALDQLGAMVGPLIIAVALYLKSGYAHSFALLLIPALLALMTLFFARYQYPRPQTLDIPQNAFKPQHLKSTFWLYVISASLVAAGFADFPLIAYHFQKTALLSPVWIPIFYAIAMGLNTLTAPWFGHLYDRKGFSILIIVTAITCLFAPLIFFGGFTSALLGTALWSTGVSTHESLMRAIIANMTTAQRRASAYGLFNMIYGISWFLGSLLMGVLYDVSIMALVIFSILIQLTAIPLLIIIAKRMQNKS